MSPKFLNYQNYKICVNSSSNLCLLRYLLSYDSIGKCIYPSEIDLKLFDAFQNILEKKQIR
jgi:hypothetical protein